MTAGITADRKIHDVVNAYPETMEVIRAYGLDACCGGSLTLRQGAAAHGIDLDELLAALRAVVEAPSGGH